MRRKFNNTKKWIISRPYYIRRFVNRKLIRRRNFTIISNNCWAGKVYQYLDMPYLSPTVGLYFFAEDYIKFISNLRYYLSLELKFISVEQSRYKNILKKKKETTIPIARLDDVEIIFLHYKTESEAREKWNRRKERVNYDDVILKFSRMNLCTEKHMERFDELPYGNKIMLNNVKSKKYESEIYWKGFLGKKEILSDTKNFPGSLHLAYIINKKISNYPKNEIND